MKIKVCILLCLALLLSCVSVALSFTTWNSKDDSPVKDSTVDQDSNDKNEAPSDEPSDEPSEEEPSWTLVELTDVTDMISEYGFGDTVPPAEKALKFTVEEDGIYYFNRSDTGSWLSVIDHVSKTEIKSDGDYSFYLNLVPGDYVVGAYNSNDVEVYRYVGDFSEFEVEAFANDPDGSTFDVVCMLSPGMVLKIVCDKPITVTSIEGILGSPISDETITLDVYYNDGNGTVYFLLPYSFAGGTTFWNYEDFGPDVTDVQVYSVSVVFDLEEEEDTSTLDLIPLSLRASLAEETDESEQIEEMESTSWSASSDEIVEYPDGRTFINGEEVLWSDVIIVG